MGMLNKKRGQIGMEYLMIIGFLTFVLITVLGVALYNSNTINQLITSRQVENLGQKIISSAESVFYSGEPSKATIVVNIPDGINNITIADGTYLIITYQTSTGLNVIDFKSNVPLSGSISNTVSGLRKIQLTATEVSGSNTVVITS